MWGRKLKKRYKNNNTAPLNYMYVLYVYSPYLSVVQHVRFPSLLNVSRRKKKVIIVCQMSHYAESLQDLHHFCFYCLNF